MRIGKSGIVTLLAIALAVLSVTALLLAALR